MPCDVNYDNSYVEPFDDINYNFAENGGYQVNFDFDNKKITASKTSDPIELNVVDIMDYGYEEGLANIQKFLSDYNFDNLSIIDSYYRYIQNIYYEDDQYLHGQLVTSYVDYT
jgi:hypothetical protein